MSIYGIEVSTFAGPGGAIDGDPLGTLLTTERAVLERVARRFMSPAGSVPGSPNMGYDLREKLGGRVTEVQRARCRFEVEAEADKEECVRKATCTEITLRPDGRWRIRIALALATGTFALTLAVSQVTIDLLGFEL